MRSKFVLITLMAASVLIVGTGRLRAQNGDEIDFDELAGERLPYFGLGAGYQRMFILVNYDEMNKVSRELGLGDFSGPVAVDMGGLVFTPGFVPNLRAGIFVGTGTTQLSRQVRPHDSTLYTRTMYFGTLLVTTEFDYAITISNAFTIFPGVLLGGGRTTIGASQARSSGTRFDEVFNGAIFRGDNSIDSTNLNRFARALSYHVYIYPQVNFEYTLTPNVMVRLGVGYNASVPITHWADEGGVDMADPPNIGSNGLALQGGIFVGLFQH